VTAGEIAADPPAGFVELPPLEQASFDSFARPWFLKAENGTLVGGLRVMSHHANPNGVCHGGMLATFCDVHMSVAAVYQHGLAPRLLPTVSLALDFLQPIPLGAWVEGRAQLLRAGRRLAFIQDLLTVDGVPAVRASGAFSVPSADTGGEAMRQRIDQLLGR
jgi:uncharacterized protein (TIGR00369 family)